MYKEKEVVWVGGTLITYERSVISGRKFGEEEKSTYHSESLSEGFLSLEFVLFNPG